MHKIWNLIDHMKQNKYAAVQKSEMHLKQMKGHHRVDWFANQRTITQRLTSKVGQDYISLVPATNTTTALRRRIENENPCRYRAP